MNIIKNGLGARDWELEGRPCEKKWVWRSLDEVGVLVDELKEVVVRVSCGGGGGQKRFG
jgi:hypothetical protein